MSVQSELKALESQRIYAETHLAEARAQLREAQVKIQQFETKLYDVNRKINQFKRRQDGLIISEHAILRYMERVMGVDIEALKKEICGGRDPREIDPSGGLILLPIGLSHKLRVQDGVAVTTITNDNQER